MAAETVNHLRGYLSRAFNAARRAGLFNGQSPVTETSKRRVPRRKPDYLRALEVGPVLAALSESWRPLSRPLSMRGFARGNSPPFRNRTWTWMPAS
jgi:integrase